MKILILVMTFLVSIPSWATYKSAYCLAALKVQGESHRLRSLTAPMTAAAITDIRDFRIAVLKETRPEPSLRGGSFSNADATKAGQRLRGIEENFYFPHRSGDEDLVVWGSIYEGKENIEAYIHEVTEISEELSQRFSGNPRHANKIKASAGALFLTMTAPYFNPWMTAFLVSIGAPWVVVREVLSLAPATSQFFKTVSENLSATARGQWYLNSINQKIEKGPLEEVRNSSSAYSEEATELHIEQANPNLIDKIFSERGVFHWVNTDHLFYFDPESGVPRLVVVSRMSKNKITFPEGKKEEDGVKDLKEAVDTVPGMRP